MARLSIFVLISFVLGGIVTTTLSGCSKPADRTLTIYQLQSTETYNGPFKLNTSELPSDAIESIEETGDPNGSFSRITLSMDYNFEVVLRLVDSK